MTLRFFEMLALGSTTGAGGIGAASAGAGVTLGAAGITGAAIGAEHPQAGAAAHPLSQPMSQPLSQQDFF
ncbi:MAG: hypothetical protein AAFU85_31570, partial [Planctomycetota bacterium]